VPVCSCLPFYFQQEDASPYSLIDICLNFLSANIEKFCIKKPDGLLCFREPVGFPQEVADRLLQTMAYQGVLNEVTVGIFRGNHIRLKRACIRKAKISAVAFCRAFCHHKLIELDASGVNVDITITDIINGLATNKWIQQNLQCLVLNSLTLSLEDPYERCFSQLSGLRALSITNVLFYNEDLADVASLPRLESLDISNTSVTDITPLLSCKDRLKSLTMHHLKCLKMTTSQILDVIGELKLLSNLDISDDKQFTSDIALRLLEQKNILPNLTSLDISGRKYVTDKAVEAFVQQRPTMQFMGLLATDAGYSEFLSGQGNLKGGGGGGFVFLNHHFLRFPPPPNYLGEAWGFYLFILTNETSTGRPDQTRLVVTGMRNHPMNLPVQLAASACVFNLTKQDLAAGMPVRLLADVTHLLLKAMEHFPNHQQLQKNCLLSLCSDRILQDVPFNRFEAAKLVMQWLCNHEDHNMQRMAVAIISIILFIRLLSTEQTAQLGAELFIVKQLLHIVEQKTNQNTVDTTLKFTLSALWNLTDESPTTCRHFIENKGLELFMRVLESFPSESSIQQKVLGLLGFLTYIHKTNNITSKENIEHIRTIQIEQQHRERSCKPFKISCAATLSKCIHTFMLQHSAILKWPTPECEMVAYRSFNPFFPLLECFSTPGVQLWAVWAMQHVCSKNAARYCNMLIEEGGMQQLYAIRDNLHTNPDVQKIAVVILESLEKHIVRHGRPPSSKKQPSPKSSCL
uniref:Zyg-11 family member, cell cycle regulator, like n=1 Tax=Latimeria chalumnae TaxID=7897 RepID=H3A2E0_LATCH